MAQLGPVTATVGNMAPGGGRFGPESHEGLCDSQSRTITWGPPSQA